MKNITQKQSVIHAQAPYYSAGKINSRKYLFSFQRKVTGLFKPRSLLMIVCLVLLPYSLSLSEQLNLAKKVNAASVAVPNKQPIMGGIRFECRPEEIEHIKSDMNAYFTQLEFPTNMINQHRCHRHDLCYTLKTPRDDTNTINLATRPELNILPEILEYQRGDGKIIRNAYTSKKEIVAALMQHGREYVLRGPRCSVNALRDHVGVRQNIAKWAQIALMRWNFPEEWVFKNGKWATEGRAAQMNPSVWGKLHDRFIPEGVAPHVAVADAFIGSYNYSMGCLTATKLIMIQGIMDYYRHVKKDQKMADYLDQIAKRAPIDDIVINRQQQGKYLTRQDNIVGNNIIPGDWIYIDNPDPKSADIAGYEGANKIYIGGDRFSSLYQDSPNARHTSPYYLQSPHNKSLDYITQEVFNWRFNILEDYENNPKRAFLTRQQVIELRNSPDDKLKPGLLLTSRKFWADLILPENNKKS